MFKIEKESYIDRVVSFAGGDTYEIVRDTLVHAHPVKRGFPSDVSACLMVRGKGGISHELFKVEAVYEFNPDNNQELGRISNVEHQKSIGEYIRRRNVKKGFSKAPNPYRFYILTVMRVFDPAFKMVPNIQGFKYYTLNEVRQDPSRNDVELNQQDVGNTEQPNKSGDVRNDRKQRVFEMAEQLGLDCRLLPYENQIVLKNERKQVVCMIRPSRDYYQLMSSKEFKGSEYHSGWRYKFAVRFSTIEETKKAIVGNIIPLFERGDLTHESQVFREDDPDLLLEADLLDEEVDRMGVVGADREMVVKQRINQSVFRDRLIKKYAHCCLCSVSNNELLKASHIKPWSVSSPQEKVDVNNGLLLCPNHDALFDKGYITFDEEGRIVISERLSEVDLVYMNVHKDMQISFTNKQSEYMEYHRREIYEKWERREKDIRE